MTSSRELRLMGDGGAHWSDFNGERATGEAACSTSHHGVSSQHGTTRQRGPGLLEYDDEMSSGIGAALALEYATQNTHLVLIARDEARLKAIASRAKAKGSTASTHSIDSFEPENLAQLYKLRGRRQGRGYRHRHCMRHRNSDVLGQSLKHVAAGANSVHSNGESSEDGALWGAATTPRMLQVNVAANQEFILRSWELMKAREQSNQTLSLKLIVLSSSTAFFTPATFALYAASKAYLYSLTRSLRIASVPYGNEVITVMPGFMETGMTATMQMAGATTPEAILGDPRKLAAKIKRVEESGGQDVVFYPASQVWALWSLQGLNPLLETFALWLAAATGVAGWFFS
ncbi:hypothetical protein QBC40DRAFT_316022 [Triangularia verruculosa]|uniref:Uncharacterized protein n=1 Tax=Triangularia verruculosa TaxID=2587418 RepID=A0AAN6X7D6_9PEZI|nr:hypothetical protein QBC40DRAFT_316022 [Triangularia verruculosa]